ncbi:MAG: MoaD/ThiS family protein [Planctomycetota bacterium]|jgi:molybdopterin synthase catalytic subunit
MRILLFAGLAEAMGQREIALPGDHAPSTVGELEAAVRAVWPALADRPFRVAVNQAYRHAEDAVAEADEIALIPPVSGG